LSRPRYHELNLKVGDVVYVTPKNIRVFEDLDFSI